MVRSLLSILTCVSAAAAFILTSDSPFILCGTGNETSAVQLAEADVLSDAYKVLGHPPLQLYELPTPGSFPVGTTFVVLGSLTACPDLRALVPLNCFEGWESHCMIATDIAGYPAVVATGTGDRGAIFAAYTFSEQILNVNPWYRFTDDPPLYLGTVKVNTNLSTIIAPPLYRYRAVFFNDEDLLGGLRSDPMAKNVFDMYTYNMLFETLLRLKGNGAIVASNPFPDEDSVALASRRGVVVVHHHYNCLGTPLYAWPFSQADWNYRLNAGAMNKLWESSIAAQLDKEVLWSVGLRGTNDISYACANTTDCGAQISDVLANQTALIQSAQPGAPMILFLWDELLEYLASGDLIIPSGVRVVFTDAGDGFIRINSNTTRWATGVYYHTMMYDGFANQLTELVPVDRIIQQVSNFSSHANETFVFILNLSDMLPVPMSSQAVLQMAWDPTPFLAHGDTPLAAALSYYKAWGVRQFGLAPTDADAFAALWAAYYNSTYIQGGLGDQFFSRVTRNRAGLATADVIADGHVSAATANRSAADAAAMGGPDAAAAMEALFAAAEAFAASGVVPTRRAPYFAAHTVLQFGTHAKASRALSLLSVALNMSASGDNAGAVMTLQTLLQRFEELFALRRAAEYAPWHGLYANDHLADFNLVRRFVVQLVAALSSPKGSPLLPTGPMVDYNLFEAYQTPAMTTTYPRIHANATWNLLTYVRINCVAKDVTSNICASNPAGGGFRAATDVAVTMEVGPEVGLALGATGVILYTTDGSPPTSASLAYTDPISLNAFGTSSVTLRAAAFIGEVTTQITDSRFVRW
jgi:hypothetical protein